MSRAFRATKQHGNDTKWVCISHPWGAQRFFTIHLSLKKKNLPDTSVQVATSISIFVVETMRVQQDRKQNLNTWRTCLLWPSILSFLWTQFTSSASTSDVLSAMAKTVLMKFSMCPQHFPDSVRVRASWVLVNGQWEEVKGVTFGLRKWK